MPDFIVMPKRLTAENGAKSLMIGEFFVSKTVTCPDCDGDGCEDCKGVGGFEEKIPIPWTTIKEIYSKAANHFGEPITIDIRGEA